MSIPPVIVTQKCIHCGALSQTKDGKCWLCYESVSTPNPFAVSAGDVTDPTPSLPFTTWDVVFGVLLGVCVLLTFIIALGLAVQDRGMLIPFAILVGPAYVVTIVRGTIPSRSAGVSRPASLFLTFVVSLLATVSISIVLMIAAAIMLFLICIGVFGSGGF